MSLSNVRKRSMELVLFLLFELVEHFADSASIRKLPPDAFRELGAGNLQQTQDVIITTSEIETANGLTVHFNTTSNGATHLNALRVEPEEWTYTWSIKSYVPESGQYVPVIVYTVVSNVDINQTADNQLSQSPTGLKLLAVTVDTYHDPWSNAAADAGCGLANQIPILGTALNAFDVCNNNFVTQAQMKQSLEEVNKNVQANAKAWADMNDTVIAVQSTVHSIQDEVNGQILWNQKTTDVLHAVETQANTTENGLVNLTSMTIQKYQIQQRINQNLQNEFLILYDNFYKNQQSSEGAFQNGIINELLLRDNRTRARDAELNSEFIRLQQAQVRGFTAVTQDLQRVSLIGQNGITFEPLRPRVAKVQWRGIHKVEAIGYEVFLSDKGTEPVADIFNLQQPAYVMGIVATQRLYTRNGNIPVASVIVVVTRCWKVYLASYPVPVVDIFDLLNGLGGLNCTTTNQRTNQFCSCWMEVEEHICDIKGQATPDGTALGIWRNTSDTTLITSSTVCQTGTTATGSFNGRIVKTPQQYWQLHQDICSQGVDSHMLHYRVQSNTRRKSYDAAFSTAACTTDLSQLMFPTSTDQTTYTMVYMMGLMLSDSYQKRATKTPDIVTELYGGVANDITWQPTKYFQRVNEGQMGPKYSAGFMAFTPRDCSVGQYCNFWPVYEVEFSSVTARAFLSTDGGPEVEISAENIEIINPDQDKILPRTGDLFVGDPVQSWIGNAPLVNVNAKDLDSVRYNEFNGTIGFTQKNWTDYHSVPDGTYDAFAGRRTASEFYQYVDLTTHTCTTVAPGGKGTICNLLDRFDVTTDSLTKTIVYSARGGANHGTRLKITATIGAGEIDIGERSVCPNVTPLKNTATTDIFQITNPIGDDNHLRIIQGPNCPNTQDIILSAFATDRVSISFCPKTNLGPETLKIYFFIPSTGFYPCNGTVAAVISTTPGSTPFATTQTYVDGQTEIYSDLSATLLGKLVFRQFSHQMEAAVLNYKQQLVVSGDYDPIQLQRDYRQHLIDLNVTAALILDTNNLITQQQQLNLSAVLQQYEDQADIDKSNVNAAFEAQAEAFNALIGLKQKADTNLGILDASIKILQSAILNVTLAAKDFQQYVDGYNGGSHSGLDLGALGRALSAFWSAINPLAWPGLLADGLKGILGDIGSSIFGGLLYFVLGIYLIGGATLGIISFFQLRTLKNAASGGGTGSGVINVFTQQPSIPKPSPPPPTAPQTFAGHPFYADKIAADASSDDEIPLVLSKQQQQHPKREPSPLFSSSSSYNDDSIMNLGNDTF